MKLHSSVLARLEYKWLVFGVVSMGTFVSVADQTGVNLALPRIADHFDATIPFVQWVALGYILTTGSLLLPMGRLSDMVGRKRVYTIGFTIFTGGAVLAGSSASLLGVIFFKVLQGVGAAMIQSTGMAIVTTTFSSSERGKVIGLFMTVVGVGAIAGPALGGAVVGLLGWRYIFFLGAPLGIVSIISAMAVLRGIGAPGEERRPRSLSFDWVGALLSTLAMAVLLLAMTNAYRVGWRSLLVIGAFAGVGALFVIFVWWERRTPEPMLNLELFRRRLFSLGVSAGFLTFISGASVYFLMPFYLQEVLGYTPGQAGLTMVPSPILFAVIGPIAGRLSDRFGWQAFAVVGLVCFGVSLLILSRLTEDSSVMQVVVAMVIQGAGMGAFYSPNASAVLSVVERPSYGIATAFLNMVRNTANVIGVAVATTAVAVIMGASGYEPSLDAVSAVGGDGVRAAFTRGLQVTYLLMSALIFIAIVMSSFKGRGRVGDPSQSADRPVETKV